MGGAHPRRHWFCPSCSCWFNKPKHHFVTKPASAKGLGIHFSDRSLKSCDKNINIVHGKTLLVLFLPL